MDKEKIEMPIRAAPYQHQKAAFEFACGLFGLTEGGDDDYSIHQIRSCGAALLCEMGTG